MLSVQSSLYTVAIAVCLFAAGILRDRSPTGSRSTSYLTVFLAIETLNFLLELLMIHPSVPLKALWLSGLMSLAFLTAPCLWLLAREIVEGQPPRLHSLHWKHFGVIGLGTLLTLPLLETTHFGLTTESPTAEATAKYARSRLDNATRERIRAKLERAMSTDALFRESRLTLRTLCRHIGEKTHAVSQVINKDLTVNFYDFVNAYRIRQAQRDLVAHPEKTILEIALDVGFNAKSTFNTAFRRIAGITPSEYRTRHGT